MVRKQNPKKIKQRSAKQFVSWLSDTDSRDSVSDFALDDFQIDFDTESYDPNFNLDSLFYSDFCSRTVVIEVVSAN